jgi:hypothetical protein
MSWKCFAAAALMLCALVSSAQTARTQTRAAIDAEIRAGFARDKAKYEPVVGKTFWVTGHVQLCPEPNPLMPQCATILAPRRFVMDRVEPGFTRFANGSTLMEPFAYCHVTSNDGLVGYVACVQLMSPQVMDVDPVVAAAQCKRQGGQPRVGVSAKLLEACWGKPRTIKHKETASGVSDKYIYDGGRSVLLHNGVVVTIRTVR